jgi:hypothetical protein
MASPSVLHLAQVRPGRIEVYRNDGVRVDAFDLPPGTSLRQSLLDHGWRPTGQRVAGRGWDVIVVEPIQRP